MTACDRNAGAGADLRAALENGADGLDRQLADRHAQDRQGHDRRSAHGIDVGNGVGRGDAPEIVGIVDHGHEEIGGGDDAGPLVDLVDGSVVAGLGADQEPMERSGRGLAGEQVLQDRRGELAAAAAAMGKAGQPHGRFDGGLDVHCRSLPEGCRDQCRFMSLKT